MSKWKVDAGNSNTGQSGFVIYDIEADSAEAALAKVKEQLPEHIEDRVMVAPGDGPWTLVAYFNTDALTLNNIEASDEQGPELTGCRSCQYIGGPVVLHGSADASCPACGADWPSEDEDTNG